MVPVIREKKYVDLDLNWLRLLEVVTPGEIETERFC